MRCPDCKASKIILDWTLGEIYCGSCGLVIEDRIVDYSDLSFTFTGDVQSIRHSISSFMLVNKGLGTHIPIKVPGIGRMVSLSGAPSNPMERSFSAALPYLQAAWNTLRLPTDVKLFSAILYRKCIRKRIIKGRKVEAMALATVYNTCRTARITRDIEGVAESLEVPAEMVYSYAATIEKETAAKLPSFYVHDYIKIGIKNLTIPAVIGNKAIEIGNSIVKRKLELGKHPAVVAGAVIYLAGFENGEQMSQKRIADSLDVSERSVRRVAKELDIFINKI